MRSSLRGDRGVRRNRVQHASVEATVVAPPVDHRSEEKSVARVQITDDAAREFVGGAKRQSAADEVVATSVASSNPDAACVLRSIRGSSVRTTVVVVLARRSHQTILGLERDRFVFLQILVISAPANSSSSPANQRHANGAARVAADQVQRIGILFLRHQARTGGDFVGSSKNQTPRVEQDEVSAKRLRFIIAIAQA